MKNESKYNKAISLIYSGYSRKQKSANEFLDLIESMENEDIFEVLLSVIGQANIGWDVYMPLSDCINLLYFRECDKK